MIFDGVDGALDPPIHRFRQRLTGTKGIPLAMVLGLHDPTLRVTSGAQKLGTVLLVGQVSKSVQANLVGTVLGIVLIDEPQVVLEDLEPPVFLSNPVVGFLVLHKPFLVDLFDFGLASRANA